MSATSVNTTGYNASLTLSSSYQNLATLLVAAGFTDIGNTASLSATVMFKNLDTSITCYVATGYTTAPTGNIGSVASLASITYNAGLNANNIWVKGASGSPVLEVSIGTVAVSNTALSGLIGTITLTNNTVPKGSSNNLVNSSIVDNGTTVAISEPVTSTGSILSSSATGGVGYATGAGAAVSQGTNRTTGVTINAPTGAITLFSTAGSATAASFTVTNSAVATTDTINLSQKSGTDAYALYPTSVGAGSFRITVVDLTGTTVEAPVVNFCVVKGVAS